MPAILYFATAAAILRIVHGTTTTLSRRAAIVLLLLPLLLTGRALVTGGVYGPIDLAYDEEPLASLARDHGITSVGNPMLTDVQRLMIPWRAAVRYAFAHGEWPLWNPFTFSGDILAAASEPSPWHPFHLLGQLLPLAQSITFEATLVFFAAALAAFLFARDLGASEDASFVAAAGWMLSQFILFFGQVPLGAAVLMQPLVFVSVRRIAERPDWRSIARLAIVLALVVVAGHPESTLHVVTLGIAWGVFEMVRLRSWSRAARVAGAATLAGILALLLSSIHLLPFLEALPQTADYELRVTKFANERRWVDALEAAVRLLRAIVPFVFGSPATETAAVPARYYDPAFPYAGSIVIAAAAAGWLGWRDRARWFLAGLAVFGFLAGVSAPGISHLLARLPLFEIALNERFIFSAVLAVVTLAAFGVDRMASGRWSAVPLAVTVAIAGTVAALWPWMLSRGLTTTHLHQNAVREIVPLALASAVFLIGPSRRSGAAAITGLLLMQRLLEDGRMTPHYPASAFYPRTPVIDALPRGPEPYRVAGTGSILVPNTSAHYGIEDPRGFHGMVYKRLAATLPFWSRPIPVSHNEITDLDSPFLDFLNVRYAIVKADEEVPSSWPLRLVSGGAKLVENPDALPRAFLPRAITGSDDLPRTGDFAAIATVGPSIDGRSGAPDGTRPNGTGRVQPRRAGTGLTIDAVLESDAWIVVSETAWNGWRATIDGVRAPLHFANHAFLAIRVPAGTHRIRLHYLPRSFISGALITLFAVAAMTAVSFRGKVR